MRGKHRKRQKYRQLVDQEMARLINEGELRKICSYQFIQPHSRKDANMPMDCLLRGSLQYPSDKTAQ